jgi:hypothetical protein
VISTPFGKEVEIPIVKLLTRASDPDGDAVSLVPAGSASTHGGVVASGPGSIRYTPPAGFSGADTVAFTLSDGRGASTAATVTVQVGQAPNAGGVGSNPPALTMLPDGKVGISFQGIPGRSYTVQRSGSGLSDWETLAVVTADAAGRVSFTDDNPPPGSAFYRLGLP